MPLTLGLHVVVNIDGDGDASSDVVAAKSETGEQLLG
jgi:hypothetical protein